MTTKLLLGDCRETMKTLPDGSCQTCVTYPPYYGLRDYGVDGQIGLEQSPEAYVENLVLVFREVRRVLADDGTLWLNLGDSYAGSGKGGQSDEKRSENWQPTYGNKGMLYGLKPKDLIGIPWRVAFALQADGWWLRSDIIWHKPNPMPESVTDRPTKAHEYIFLLSKAKEYYCDMDSIREPYIEPMNRWGGQKLIANGESEWDKGTGQSIYRDRDMRPNPLGRNRRDVWTVTTKPYKGAHFATFPPDLIEPCILAGTSERGQCPKCGKAWERVTNSIKTFESGSGRSGNKIKGKQDLSANETNSTPDIRMWPVISKFTTGWRPQCECGLDPIAQSVLDPFNGAGTTGLVAIQHGRNYIGCELNPNYIEMTEKRLQGIQVKLLGE